MSKTITFFLVVGIITSFLSAGCEQGGGIVPLATPALTLIPLQVTTPTAGPTSTPTPVSALTPAGAPTPTATRAIAPGDRMTIDQVRESLTGDLAERGYQLVSVRITATMATDRLWLIYRISNADDPYQSLNYAMLVFTEAALRTNLSLYGLGITCMSSSDEVLLVAVANMEDARAWESGRLADDQYVTLWQVEDHLRGETPTAQP